MASYYFPRCLGLILIGLLIYAQTFQFGFVFDDNFFILDTPYIRSFENINQIWAILPRTRMVGIYSLALNYHINQLFPQGYHIFNFVVHLLATGLVWALATVLFEIEGWVPSGSRPKGANQELPFVIALFFLVHPCQTQAVTYISQRFESMATVFYLASIYFYLGGRIASSQRHKIFLLAASVVFAILGIFTKEVAVTIPLMVWAAEAILFNRDGSNFKKFPSRLFYFPIIGLGVLFIFLLMKMVHTNLNNLFLHFSASSGSYDGDVITGGKYVLTQMRVFLTFLRLLILPMNQNLDYDYPVSTDFFNPPLTMVGLCVVGFMVFLIFKLRHRWPLIAFGLAWILITFSINIVPRANVIFEHKLYLISFGFFLTSICALSMIIKDRKILIGLLITLIAVLSVVSYNRNQVWKNEETLWEDVTRKSPHKARAFDGLGVAYAKEGQFERAFLAFNKAIEIKPDFAEGYNNRGNAYRHQGNYTQALIDFNKAIALEPNYFQAYVNRAEVYKKYREISGQH